MKANRPENLFDIVFRDRNRTYGAYLLWKRYPGYLLRSLLIGITGFVLLFAGPLIYYLAVPNSPAGEDLLDAVEYYSVMPPPPDTPDKLPGTYQPPPQEQAPLVTDSAIEEKLKPEEPPVPDLQDESPSDSAGRGQGNTLDGKGNGDAGGLVTQIDVYPRYPGGDDARLWFLRKNIRYPDAAMKAGVQGVVLVVFIIEADGNISNVEVTKKIGGGCDEEAVRVVKLMPRWEPARRNGQPVRVVVRMPVIFRMPGK